MFLSVGLFAPSTFGLDTEERPAVGEGAAIHTRRPLKQNLSRHIYQPEQNHSAVKQEMLIAARLTNQATWLQLKEEQTVPAWLLHHPTRLPVPFALPVPGKVPRITSTPWQGAPTWLIHSAPADLRGVWGSQGKVMQGRLKLLPSYLRLIKLKHMVSKILPFSEILLSDLFNSTGSRWAVVCLWPSQTILNNLFIWDIIKYGSQQDSLAP